MFTHSSNRELRRRGSKSLGRGWDPPRNRRKGGGTEKEVWELGIAGTQHWAPLGSCQAPWAQRVLCVLGMG